MTLLYIIRHASPAIRPDVPSREWTLSERGVAEAGVLAGAAESWGIEAIYASDEPKMRTTGLIIGDALGLPVHVVDGFGELRISDWISNADEFNELVRAILEGPQTPDPTSTRPPIDTRNAERADAAAERFAEAVRIVQQGPVPAAVVSGGRIITAYITRFGGLEEPFEFWRTIPMPGWACVDIDGDRVRLVSGFSA